MNRSLFVILSLIVTLMASQLGLNGCAGLPNVPESEKKHIKGVIVEGGKFGFRLRSDEGEILRFRSKDAVVHHPAKFHAYYGDRISVTYFTENKKGKKYHEALEVRLLVTNPERIDLSSGFMDGVVRQVGVMRYLVHVPKLDHTLAFYDTSAARIFPPQKKFKGSDKVRVYYREKAERYYRKLTCHRIDWLGGVLAIHDRTETGIVTEIQAHRKAQKAPDRFVFQLTKGESITISTGRDTLLVPPELNIEIGQSYMIQFYSLLMGDQSTRYVAARIYAE